MPVCTRSLTPSPSSPIQNAEYVCVFVSPVTLGTFHIPVTQSYVPLGPRSSNPLQLPDVAGPSVIIAPWWSSGCATARGSTIVVGVDTARRHALNAPGASSGCGRSG